MADTTKREWRVTRVVGVENLKADLEACTTGGFTVQDIFAGQGDGYTVVAFKDTQA